MDILTISAINLIVGLCLFFTLFFHSKNDADVSYFKIFSLAGLCLTLNSLISITSNVITLPIYLMPALANAATVCLHSVVLMGLLKLCGRQFNALYLVLPVVVSFCLTFIEPFKTEMTMRLIANFALILVLNAISLRVLWSCNTPSFALTLLKATLIVNMVQLLGRSIFYLLYELDVSQFAESPILHQIGWFAFTLYCFGLLASFVLLVTEKKQKELELKASTDPLTGLLNRNELITSLSKELDRCLRQEQSMTLVMLDVDYFKQINDTYGHAVGDSAIQHVAFVLKEQFRSYDLLFRIGGEEFLACLPNVDAAQAKIKLEHLRQEFLHQPLRLQEEIKITVSMGWVSTRQDMDLNILLKSADDALYQAKKQGRNRVLEAVL
jgi:diguanylate cyclase (GGDEF)-like protein